MQSRPGTFMTALLFLSYTTPSKGSPASRGRRWCGAHPGGAAGRSPNSVDAASGACPVGVSERGGCSYQACGRKWTRGKYSGAQSLSQADVRSASRPQSSHRGVGQKTPAEAQSASDEASTNLASPSVPPPNCGAAQRLARSEFARSPDMGRVPREPQRSGPRERRRVASSFFGAGER